MNCKRRKINFMEPDLIRWSLMYTLIWEWNNTAWDGWLLELIQQLSDLLSGWKKPNGPHVTQFHDLIALYMHSARDRELCKHWQEWQSKFLYRVERKEIYHSKLVWNYSSLLFLIPCALISKMRRRCNWRLRGHLCLSARVHAQRQHSFILLCFDVEMNE